MGLAQARLGDVARAKGDHETAARHYRAALDDLNDANEISRVLDALAAGRVADSSA